MILAAINWDNIWNTVTQWCMSVGKNLLISILVLFVGSKLIKFLIKRISKSLHKSSIEETVCRFLVSLIKFALYFVLIIIIITILGIPTTSFIAALSAAGLAIGLALQGSLSNFAGGVLILLFKPFTIGDYIKEDTHNNEGMVVGIDLFYTRIRGAQDKIILIPNGVLANSSLTNFSNDGKRILFVNVGISYGSDIKKAKSLIMDILNSNEHIIEKENAGVDVVELADSQVTLRANCCTKAEDYYAANWELNEKIKEAFDANGIEIPFNQLTVTLNERDKKEAN